MRYNLTPLRFHWKLPLNVGGSDRECGSGKISSIYISTMKTIFIIALLSESRDIDGAFVKSWIINDDIFQNRRQGREQQSSSPLCIYRKN